MPVALVTHRMEVENQISKNPNKADYTLLAVISMYAQLVQMPYYEKIHNSLQLRSVLSLASALNDWIKDHKSAYYKNFKIKIGKFFLGFPLFNQIECLKDLDKTAYKFVLECKRFYVYSAIFLHLKTNFKNFVTKEDNGYGKI